MAKDLKSCTALFLQGEKVSWTTASFQKKKLEAHHRMEQELPPPPSAQEAPVDRTAETGQLLRDHLQDKKSPVCLIVPTSRALLRVMNFPTVDPEELKGMIDLQVGKISPFPVDQLQVSMEILKQQDGISHVLIAAVRHSVIEESERILKEAHLKSVRIDIELLGWWQQLKEAKRVSTRGCQLFLLVEKKATGMILVCDGIPAVFRSLSPVGEHSWPVFAEELKDEIDYTLTSLEAEWGFFEDIEITLFHDPDYALETVSRALEEHLACTVNIATLEEVGCETEGVARRTLAGDHTLLNLIPQEWTDKEALTLARLKVMRISAVLLIIWAMLVGSSYVFSSNRSERAGKLAIQARELIEPAQKINLIQEKVEVLEQYTNRTYSALESLREISVLLPASVDLTSFSYRKNSEVSLRGLSRNAQSASIYDFFEALEKSELFASVEDQQLATRDFQSQRRAQFSVKVTFSEVGE